MAGLFGCVGGILNWLRYKRRHIRMSTLKTNYRGKYLPKSRPNRIFSPCSLSVLVSLSWLSWLSAFCPYCTTHTQNTNIRDPGGIRTRNPIKQATTNLHPRPREYRDRSPNTPAQSLYRLSFRGHQNDKQKSQVTMWKYTWLLELRIKKKLELSWGYMDWGEGGADGCHSRSTLAPTDNMYTLTTMHYTLFSQYGLHVSALSVTIIRHEYYT